MTIHSKFFIYLGGEHVGSSSSLDGANDDLTQAVLDRAMKGNGSAVTGEIRNVVGDVLQTREFEEAIYHGVEDEL